MRDRLFRDKEFIKRLMMSALPICFQMLMLASVAASDALMLGSVNQNSMAAVSLATQIQFLQNMIMSAFIGTASILGAQYWGKKDIDTLEDIFALTLRINVFVALLFFAGCVFFPRNLMLLYTNEEVLVEIGIKYLKIAGFSYLVTGVSQCYEVIIRVTDHIPAAAKLSATAVLVNIVMNAIMIYGFHMGAEGAAIATLAARIIEFFIAVILSFRPTFLALSLGRLFRFNRLLTIDFFKCMLPLLGASLLWSVGFTSYTSFMGHLGTDAAAANSVTAVVRDLVCCATDGLAQGGGIMVGNELGAGRLKRGKLYGIRMVKISYMIGFASTAIMLIITPFLLNAVKLTPLARHYLAQMMVIVAVYMIGRAVNTVTINGVFSAGGDTMFDLYSLAVVMWCVAVPLAALGTYIFHWTPAVIYACTCLDEVGKIPWVMYHFGKYKWVKDLTR